MDSQRLKASFARVTRHGDEVALFFYSDLFLRNPKLRDLFPVGMAHQRDRLLSALGRMVSSSGDLAELRPIAEQLGRDHRKFGIQAEHYPQVGASLLATLRYFSGPAWNDDLARQWADAYGLFAELMLGAAGADATERPSWWNAQVISHERRSIDIAVVRMATGEPLPYAPGQAVALETPRRPRMWRYYSMANAPRADQTVDFHVKLVDGGPVSTVLVRSLRVGERVRLGPPIGTMTLDAQSGRDILLVGGSTGLAPLKALLDQITRLPSPPRTRLFFGARTAAGLYDLDDLIKRAAEHQWLTVVAAVSDEDPPSVTVDRGTLADVLSRHGPWPDTDAYVCGTPQMVEATIDRLVSMGLSRERIRQDDFASAWGW